LAVVAATVEMAVPLAREAREVIAANKGLATVPVTLEPLAQSVKQAMAETAGTLVMEH
jgi:hypothetical protein